MHVSIFILDMINRLTALILYIMSLCMVNMNNVTNLILLVALLIFHQRFFVLKM